MGVWTLCTNSHLRRAALALRKSFAAFLILLSLPCLRARRSFVRAVAMVTGDLITVMDQGRSVPRKKGRLAGGRIIRESRSPGASRIPLVHFPEPPPSRQP